MGKVIIRGLAGSTGHGPTKRRASLGATAGRIMPGLPPGPGNPALSDNVVHKKFGVGKITSVTLDKGDHVIEIQFKKSGMKRLVAEYANLVKL